LFTPDATPWSVSSSALIVTVGQGRGEGGHAGSEDDDRGHHVGKHGLVVTFVRLWTEGPGDRRA
jgi:hypothetical protein